MSHRLRGIIQEEMCCGPASTFVDRLHKRLAQNFKEIKTVALREVVDQIKHELDLAKVELEHRQTVINTLNKENEELKEHLIHCFSQGTHVRPDFQNRPDYWVYDHMCLSAYENAQDFLIELGLIKKEECTRG